MQTILAENVIIWMYRKVTGRNFLMNNDNKKTLCQKVARIYMDGTIQRVMEILEANDGRTFNEKKQEVINYLKGQDDTLLAERLLDAAVGDEAGRCCKEKFWQYGDKLLEEEHIILRKVCETDREMFIELQKETSMVKSMFKDEAYCTMFWNEHTQDKALMATIEVDGEYAGYCGINNLAHEQWEIGIELLKKWRGKGIGYIAVSTFLSAIKSRIQIREFFVKIDPENYVSQRLFEKLGAVPYGISEFMLHKEEDICRCEEENLQSIDDNLIKVAEKFGLEPRKLLSHVLEYKLNW